ncbi:hypothetical protein D910_06946, partial [Dendroctonus ponderosae]
MGVIIAKFRKSRSTAEVLTKLETEIGSIEEFQTKTRQAQRKIVFRFIILAIGIYASLGLSIYFQFFKISENQKLLWVIPFVTSPVVIVVIKKFLSWYYNRKIRRNERKLVSLKERKKKILENVMETETYKVAKDILDKFGNEPKLPLPALRFKDATPIAASSHKGPQFVNATTIMVKKLFIINELISHNFFTMVGMALKEEFEYLAFRCCYCNHMNPARKMRPAGPNVNFPLMIKSHDADKQDESSNSGGNSESDSDSE